MDGPFNAIELGYLVNVSLWVVFPLFFKKFQFRHLPPEWVGATLVQWQHLSQWGPVLCAFTVGASALCSQWVFLGACVQSKPMGAVQTIQCTRGIEHRFCSICAFAHNATYLSPWVEGIHQEYCSCRKCTIDLLGLGSAPHFLITFTN